MFNNLIKFDLCCVQFLCVLDIGRYEGKICSKTHFTSTILHNIHDRCANIHILEDKEK